MADSYQPGRQQGRGGALARRMMGRDRQSQAQGTGSVNQTVVVGFNDEILGSIDKNLKSIYAMLAKDLKVEEDSLKDQKKEAAAAKGQARKEEEGKSLASPIMGGIKKIGNIAKQVSGMGNMLDNLINAFTSIFAGWIAGKLPEIIEIVKTTWEKVKNAVTSAVNAVVNGAKAVFNFIKNIITSVIDFFKNSFNFIGEQIQRFINWITELGEKIWEGLKSAWKFVSNIPGQIGNLFKSGWDWLTGGNKEEPPVTEGVGGEKPEVESAEMPASDASMLSSIADQSFGLGSADKPASTSRSGNRRGSGARRNRGGRNTILSSTTNNNETSVTLGDGSGNVEAKPQTTVIGDVNVTADSKTDMAGQGLKPRKKPKQSAVSPVSSMTAKEGPTKEANKGAAVPEGFKRVNVRGSKTKLIPVTPEAKAQVEAQKKANLTSAQQKPAQQPLIVPMNQPAQAMAAPQSQGAVTATSGNASNSKSIPSNNSNNFYTFFSAIQYNCMANF